MPPICKDFFSNNSQIHGYVKYAAFQVNIILGSKPNYKTQKGKQDKTAKRKWKLCIYPLRIIGIIGAELSESSVEYSD